MAKWMMLLPPAIFAGLAVMFVLGMERRPGSELDTVLAGQTAPAVPVTGLPNVRLLTDADLRTGDVTVVNFWASWCQPCRAEHPVLKKMAASGIRVAGMNVLDSEADASNYLIRDGNPFFAVAADPRGRNRVEWGVTNTPETFIIDRDGTILFKFIGPLVGTDYETRFVPALEEAMK